ncbi:hypothetical protein [Micromonospora sp. NPDC023737]|uniref:hypothetical protein n=1 Tax=unclassified Micromonospora TaxID=2617518 RepID=UPI0033FDF372
MQTPAIARLAAASVLAAALLTASPAQAAAPERTPVDPAPAGTAWTATTSDAAAQAGLALTVDKDTGQWRIQQATESGITPNYPVSYCTGNFTNPRMLGSSTLEFGGAQTCDNARDWPHRIVVELQSTCSDIWCIIFQDEGSVDSLWRMSRVANAFGGLGCDNSDRRKYRLVTDVYARNIYIGAVVGSTEPILPCSM